MRVLAIDTALGATSVALYDRSTDTVLAEETAEMTRGHSEALIPMVARVVVRAGLAFQSIDRFAASVGPGSFTGIRIGVAAARGFALAHKKPTVGVSTLSAFAAPEVSRKTGIAVVAVIDARHGMVFCQHLGGDGRALHPPRLIAIDDLVTQIGDQPVQIVGDAAEVLAAALRKDRIGVMPKGSTVEAAPAPQIGWIARLGALADPHTAPARPLYLREANVTVQDSARLRRAPSDT